METESTGTLETEGAGTVKLLTEEGVGADVS